MSFWANKLGQAPAPAAPPPPPGPWWQTPKPQPAQVPPPAQFPGQYQPAQQVVAPLPGTPVQGVATSELLAQDEYTSEKAQSAKDNEPCPDCGSVNYMRPPNQPRAMKACFDCGYNERFLHTTHGATGIGQSDLPTKSSRSQDSGPGWNPSSPSFVIAHI